MSGHSHWAKIKRAKGANDAKRGKLWSKIARKIIIAARAGGGDPGQNLTLRYTIEEARAANMPRDTIEKAIAKGTGELGASNFESMVYEGYGPGGVAFLVEALTDNRSRTAPELRKVFESAGGRLATSGSVAFQFTKLGMITVKSEGMAEDALLEKALEAGAEDVKNEGDVYEVFTAPTALHKVRDALAAAKVPIEAAEVVNLPNSTVAVSEDTVPKVLRLLDALDDHEDVQNVSHNAELPESATL
ncbi:MAG TPA: YebC/PmpR family DNA-binding transcriptional regulator [Tepidisphaeraceae bacterium]|nr:YebC/PmpR family DNA-binding transcriptional regulator [Tepidisphaeraceae bacterium]